MASVEENRISEELLGDMSDAVKASREEYSVENATAVLDKCVKLDAQRKAAKKVLEDIEAELTQTKERVKDLFIAMGVKSMRLGKSNVYIAKTIWTGVNSEVNKEDLTEALINADMEDYITCNSMKLSSYVREQAKEHPELCDADGNIIGSPEEIVAALPAPFNTMFKVSEKVDIHVRK